MLDDLFRVLYIDLTKKEYHIEDRRDLFEKYIGGTGVAIQLLKEECPERTDPFSPNNPIIFAIGPLNGLFPLASKTVAMFKSPHTGNLGETHAGGRSAIAIRSAGYGGIVIKGSSETPCYLAIHGDKIFFRNAQTIWNMSSSYTVGRIIRENEPGSGYRTIMRIGKAGERLVTYSSVITETYRHFGRLGLGAVFGSKKLKAVVISGKKSIKIANRAEYTKLYDEIYRSIVYSQVMKKYHDLGTLENIIPLNKIKSLPIRNLKESYCKGVERISGEYLAEHYLGKRLACSHCPVGCIHIATIREPYKEEAYFYKTTMVGYDYEPVYANGAMLGIKDPESLLKVIDKIETLGLDAMSTGVVLAWATEAFEKGLIDEKDTLGIKLRWGDYENYMRAMELIVEQRNEFYKSLARGVDYASSMYGGKEFALVYGKNEMPGYHTGPASHIGYLVGARHSHLDNAGYSIDQNVLMEKKISPEELGKKIIDEEIWRQVLTSLVICLFARGIYKEKLVKQTLSLLGFNISEEDLFKIGKEIYKEKYEFKFREGFKFEEQSFPGRIFETESASGFLDKEYMERTLHFIKKEILKMKN